MREIASNLVMPKSTIADIIKKYGETANIDVRGKSPGRPKTVTARNQRVLVKICKSGRRNTLRAITSQWNRECGMQVSRECCRKYIRKSGLKFYKVCIIILFCKKDMKNYCFKQAKEKPLLTEIQKQRRLIWAKSKRSWTYQDWSKVIFSDEAKFDVCVGDHRKRVIRNKTETFHKDCIKRIVKFPKGIMVWGCMSAGGMGSLKFIDGTVNADKYQQILENTLLPSITKLFPNRDCIYQQDGASCHTAKSTKKWFGDHNVRVLSWPASSPDLNVIETVWHKMKQQLRNHPQRTIPELRAKLQEIWSSFTLENCEALVKTMPARIQAVIKAKGDVTSYQLG